MTRNTDKPFALGDVRVEYADIMRFNFQALL